MIAQHFCVICGKETSFGCQLCCDCEETILNNSETVEYDPSLQLIPSNSFTQNILLFFQEFFSRPDVQIAYEAYAQSHSDGPSQSLVPLSEKGVLECTL